MTAETGDLTPTLTFGGQVVDNIDFQVTSGVAGTVRIGADSSVRVIDGDGSHAVALPVQSHLDQILVADGAAIAIGQPVLQATYSGLVLKAALKPADELRFLTSPSGARAQLDGAAGPFACPLLDPTPSTDANGTYVACALPTTVRAIGGMTGTMAIRFHTVHGAVLVPLSAVSGQIDSGEVLLRQGSTYKVREVELGETDGSRIVVSSGLSAGDVVRIPGPDLGDQ